MTLHYCGNIEADYLQISRKRCKFGGGYRSIIVLVVSCEYRIQEHPRDISSGFLRPGSKSTHSSELCANRHTAHERQDSLNNTVGVPQTSRQYLKGVPCCCSRRRFPVFYSVTERLQAEVLHVCKLMFVDVCLAHEGEAGHFRSFLRIIVVSKYRIRIWKLSRFILGFKLPSATKNVREPEQTQSWQDTQLGASILPHACNTPLGVEIPRSLARP